MQAEGAAEQAFFVICEWTNLWICWDAAAVSRQGWGQSLRSCADHGQARVVLPVTGHMSTCRL